MACLCALVHWIEEGGREGGRWEGVSVREGERTERGRRDVRW